METITEKHLNKRILTCSRYSNISKNEHIVLELSPSGQYAKLKDAFNNNQFWAGEADLRVIEVLGDSDKQLAEQ